MIPIFSVVIPLYNKENHIQNTLRSVLNQSFTDFEIIIINDGSTDKSLNKAKQTFSIFKNFTIITQKNTGLSASRNRGISISKGKVIALLDADDIWHTDFLKSIYNLYLKFPQVSFYGTDYIEKYSNENILEPKKNISKHLKNNMFIVDDFFSKNIFQSILCQSSIAFKKKVFNDITFNETVNYAEDVDFYLNAFTKYKLAYLHKPLATILYNIPGQITKLGIKNKVIPNLDFYEKEYPNNQSLKKYLDFKRYMYAIQYKEINAKTSLAKITKNLSYSNLTLKQKILLKSPLAILKFLRFVKKLLLKKNIRITSFGR